MRVALIVAVAANNVIGRNNQLPWHLPQDLKYFKAVTLGKPIIMGRKTYESIGRPLPGRTNIVVSRNPQWCAAEGVVVCASLDEALNHARQLLAGVDDAEAMIIGGAALYGVALPQVERIYLTRIAAEVEGDAWFPELDAREWHVISEQEGEKDAALLHRFVVYERTVKS